MRDVNDKKTTPHRSHFDEQRIRSALEGLDAFVHQLECIWGAGRLRLLVDDDLRLRFDRQVRKSNDCLWSDEATADEVIQNVHALGRGWQALDHAARVAGYQPRPPEVIEFRLRDGRVGAIVHDDPDGFVHRQQAKADGREVFVWTVKDIAWLIEKHADILFGNRPPTIIPGQPVEALDHPKPLPEEFWQHGDPI